MPVFVFEWLPRHVWRQRWRAALDGYLRDAGLIAAPADLVIHQGDDLGRPSVISVHVPSAGGIAVTGTAVADPV